MATSVWLDLALFTPAGVATTLGQQLTQPLTIVQLVRYYGCLPCQEWAVGLDRQAPRLAELGVGSLVVGRHADYQAQYLHDEHGVRIALLLDPDQGLRRAVGAMRPLSRLALLGPRSAWAYAKAIKNGFRRQPVPGKDSNRSPGVVILDDRGTVVWQHVGEFIGDYPSHDEVIAAAVRRA